MFVSCFTSPLTEKKKYLQKKKWTQNPLFGIVQVELRACVVEIEGISFYQRSPWLPGQRLRIQVASNSRENKTNYFPAGPYIWER